jgi:hypothetical protein
MRPASLSRCCFIFSQRYAAGSAGPAFLRLKDAYFGGDTMVPQLLALIRSHPRARSRARALNSQPWPAIENLEERTLLSSATLAILNGDFTGTYRGTVTVNNNGSITKTPVTSTSFTMTINNGAINFTTPVGNGTGTVDINRNIVGTVNGQYQNQIVPISVSGKITNVNAIQTAAFGSWSFSLNLGGGVTATGSGNWSASAPQTLSNFDGNYIGTYQGAVSVTQNGSTTTTPITPGTFATVINNGVVNTGFASGPGLTSPGGTIDVTGRLNSTASFVDDGVTITVMATGPTGRGKDGVNGSGVWTFRANLPGGIFVTGRGTYTLESVLDLDGVYAGTVTGSATVDDYGTITNTPLPGSSINIQIFGESVTVFLNEVEGFGNGTAGDDGSINGLATFLENQVPVTFAFSGTGVPTANGNVLSGTWTIFAPNAGPGVTISGSGTWTATEVAEV